MYKCLVYLLSWSRLTDWLWHKLRGWIHRFHSKPEVWLISLSCQPFLSCVIWCHKNGGNEIAIWGDTLIFSVWEHLAPSSKHASKLSALLSYFHIVLACYCYRRCEGNAPLHRIWEGGGRVPFLPPRFRCLWGFVWFPQRWNDIVPFGDEDDDGKLEAWCNLIDKGGLNHVNDKTYTLFFAMEDESGLLSLNIRPVALAMLHPPNSECLMDGNPRPWSQKEPSYFVAFCHFVIYIWCHLPHKLPKKWKQLE